jgi:hypothetical protein
VLAIALQAHFEREYTYRATPNGIERTRNWWLYTTYERFSWEEFDGFSVTDDAIVLHRRLPRLDLRCSRRKIIDRETAIVTFLERHLDRQQ